MSGVLRSDLLLAGTTGALFACGLYLLMSRNLLRVLLGFLLLGHGSSLLLLSGASPGEAPIVDGSGQLADPLPQALVLTSIVITLAIATFLMAMAYRNYRITGGAEVENVADDHPHDEDAVR